MTILNADTELLPPLFDGPFEQPMWQTFLDRLARQTGADRAILYFRQPDRAPGGTVQLYAGAPPPDGLHCLYGDTVGDGDPLAWSPLRNDRVYALAELIRPDDPLHQALIADRLGPNGIADLRVLRVTEPAGLSAWLTIARARGSFATADGAVLFHIAPHLRRSLRLYSEIERQKHRSRLADAVMARLDFGWIALDAQSHIVEESEEAATLLRHGTGLRRTRGNRLVAVDPSVDRTLSAAVRTMGAGVGPARAIRISDDPWAEVLLLPSRGLSPGAVVVAYIQGDRRSLAGRHEQVAELFGLLPSEARLALALSRGLSIAEAGEALGLTLETARNYSRRIYAKTGARGQTDLVRFILTSVLSLA